MTIGLAILACVATFFLVVSLTFLRISQNAVVMEELANHTVVKLVLTLGTPGEKPLLDAMAYIMILSGIVFYVFLQFLPAPYGRYGSSKYGPLIPARFAWLIQEAPSFLIPLFVYLWMDNGSPGLGSKILVALFMAHYFHRTFFYAISIREGKPTPFIFHLLAFLFCTLNGYMQSRSILGFRGPLPHFLDPVFVFGIALFCVGMFINIQSDSILRGLRADGSRNYKIPYGGLFDYVSSANYFGEILEWWGFALAAWQLQSFSFAIFTMANLIPRAVAHHQWYLEKFRGEYPRDRYAVIPFLL